MCNSESFIGRGIDNSYLRKVDALAGAIAGFLKPDEVRSLLRANLAPLKTQLTVQARLVGPEGVVTDLVIDLGGKSFFKGCNPDDVEHALRFRAALMKGN